MNKGIKETKSDAKRNKNVSKIATRIISEKTGSPILGKDRSSSMNSLIVSEGVDHKKKIVPKEAKTKMVNGISDKRGNEPQKFADLSSSPRKDQRSTRSSAKTVEIETTEELEGPSSLGPKLNEKQKMLEQLIAREGSIEKLLEIKKTANRNTVYNVDGMSSTEIRKSVARVDSKTAEPFSFLIEMIDDPDDDNLKLRREAKDQELNPTDIDLKLASLVKRVQLNRTLLERANQRIKDINFLAERNRMISVRNMNYDEESFLKFKEAGDTCKEHVSSPDLAAVSHPAVDELKKTISSTIEMLGYVHKMSSEDLSSGEIPPELTDYLSTPITARKNDL